MADAVRSLHGQVEAVATINETERTRVFVTEHHQRSAGVDERGERTAVDLNVGFIVTEAVGLNLNIAAVAFLLRRGNIHRTRRGRMRLLFKIAVYEIRREGRDGYGGTRNDENAAQHGGLALH